VRKRAKACESVNARPIRRDTARSRSQACVSVRQYAITSLLLALFEAFAQISDIIVFLGDTHEYCMATYCAFAGAVRRYRGRQSPADLGDPRKRQTVRGALRGHNGHSSLTGTRSCRRAGMVCGTRACAVHIMAGDCRRGSEGCLRNLLTPAAGVLDSQCPRAAPTRASEGQRAAGQPVARARIAEPTRRTQTPASAQREPVDRAGGGRDGKAPPWWRIHCTVTGEARG
jgi:hypothetical protein